MELYYEEENKPKKSKTPMLLGICIAILIIIAIIIVYLIFYLRGTITKINIDGVSTSDLEKILLFDETEQGTEIYIPIRRMAKYLGYEDYSGDYINKSEDQSKCYVQSSEETVMFTLDSDTITKTRGGSDYEYINIDKKVFEKDGELYTTIDGVKKAFNVEFIYGKNRIDIYTLDYLVKYYTTQLKISDYSSKLADKKAIFENLIIVKENGQYGVFNIETQKYVLEPKYQEISYLPNTSDLLVKSNGKYGVLEKDSNIKIKIVYDDIKIMDNQNGLYMVRQGQLYGVLDTEGNTVLETEYQQIGVGNISSFSQNGVENQYILLDEIIPVKSNNLWGFFNIKGEQLTDFKYTGLGCTKSNIQNSYPVLVIPSYKLIVVAENNFYNIININGKPRVPSGVVDTIYMRTNATTGKNTYYMTFNGQTADIEERLASYGE